ncbi:MAG TPA: hypothetical protein VMR70_11995 [Flavisolibacter sp.]|nr:hypothetical protein [Flavisolibacter sp.]
MAIHKGSELNNVNETWQKNEQARQSGNAGGESTSDITAINNDLQQTIQEEAAEYDNADKEERLLDGERASVNDKKDTP